MAYNDERGLEFARVVVRGKIRNQRHLLLYFGKYLKASAPERYARIARLVSVLRGLELKVRGVEGKNVEERAETLRGLEGTAGRLYWEYGGRSPTFAAAEMTSEISLPVAITVFPGENYRAPETWARRAYRNLIYFHEVEKGGHFAAWEQPELFSTEIRAAFRPLRQLP